MSEDNKTEAQELLDSRLAVYGDRIDNMRRVALMWSGFLGVEIKPWQVPVLFALYKQYRIAITPDYSDNIDDVDGYMLMFREVIGVDMVQARTVEEYLAEKKRRERDPLKDAARGINRERAAETDIMEAFVANGRQFYDGPVPDSLESKPVPYSVKLALKKAAEEHFSTESLELSRAEFEALEADRKVFIQGALWARDNL